MKRPSSTLIGAVIIQFLALTLAVPTIGGAATFTVGSVADFPDTNPGDGLCRTSTPFCTLRAAVQEANALAGDDVVILPAAGPYRLTQFGASEDAGATGDLDVTSNITVRGTGPQGAIVQGTDDWDDRIFHVLNGGTLTVEFVSIQNGRPLAGDGGGVLVEVGGTLRLTDSVVEANAVTAALGAGGGIANRGGSLTLTRSTVQNNRAPRGGGIAAARGGVGSTSIFESEISGNGATPQLDDLAPGGGGGILVVGQRVTITQSSITGNFAVGGVEQGGGGIMSITDGALTVVRLTESTVADNFSRSSGGGIANLGLATLTISRSTISGNSTFGSCGGIDHNNRTLFVGRLQRITNSTVSGNHADGFVGGICHTARSETMELNNVTVTSNTAGVRGGGVSVFGGTLSVANSIIAGNSDNGDAPDCEGMLTSRGFNLVQSLAGCAIGGDTTGNITGRSALLGPLADNGGPTLTHLPTAIPVFMSPAIDAGNPGAGENRCETIDQRRVARPRDGNGDGVARCDIGAVER